MDIPDIFPVEHRHRELRAIFNCLFNRIGGGIDAGIPNQPVAMLLPPFVFGIAVLSHYAQAVLGVRPIAANYVSYILIAKR